MGIIRRFLVSVNESTYCATVCPRSQPVLELRSWLEEGSRGSQRVGMAFTIPDGVHPCAL